MQARAGGVHWVPLASAAEPEADGRVWHPFVPEGDLGESPGPPVPGSTLHGLPMGTAPPPAFAARSPKKSPQAAFRVRSPQRSPNVTAMSPVGPRKPNFEAAVWAYDDEAQAHGSDDSTWEGCCGLIVVVVAGLGFAYGAVALWASLPELPAYPPYPPPPPSPPPPPPSPPPPPFPPRSSGFRLPFVQASSPPPPPPVFAVSPSGQYDGAALLVLVFLLGFLATLARCLLVASSSRRFGPLGLLYWPTCLNWTRASAGYGYASGGDDYDKVRDLHHVSMNGGGLLRV